MKFDILFFNGEEVLKRISTKIGSDTTLKMNAVWDTGCGVGPHNLSVLPTARLRRTAAEIGATSWTF